MIRHPATRTFGQQRRRFRREAGHSSRVAVALAIGGGLAALLPAWAGNISAYHDDTFGTLLTARRVVELRGDENFERVKFTLPRGARGVALDLRKATFVVASSRNPIPTAANDCDHGVLPINRYPLVIEQQDRTAVVGGLIKGSVPQSSDWRATYCNSAAITFERTPNGVVDGIRITNSWDGIRLGRDSSGLLIANSWISNARDDAIENDFLQSATILDTLIDGASMGVSVKPRKTSVAASADDQLVTLSGVLLRLREYSYEGGPRYGALAKSDPRAPRLRLVNSIVAVDSSGGQTFPKSWTAGWSKLTGSTNNLFLWLSDAPIPDFLPLPPSSFQVLRGQAARDTWTRARNNWINCHPKVARLPSDPRSDAARCVAGIWGGFTE